MPPKRDPNKPKGRMTAYAFFVKERRVHHKEQGKEVEFTAFSQECSALWKDLKEEMKKNYKKMAEDDKARYDEEMRNYEPPEGAKGRKHRRQCGWLMTNVQS